MAIGWQPMDTCLAERLARPAFWLLLLKVEYTKRPFCGKIDVAVQERPGVFYHKRPWRRKGARASSGQAGSLKH
jgi:hypothetical protein